MRTQSLSPWWTAAAERVEAGKMQNGGGCRYELDVCSVLKDAKEHRKGRAG